MHCATGFGHLGSFFSMETIKYLACASYEDLVKRTNVDKQFILYQAKVCSLATKHISATFSDFEDDFCRNAPAAIKATAELMHQSFSWAWYKTGVIGVLAAAALQIGSSYAKKNGHTSIASGMRYVSYGLGLGSLMLFSASRSV